jgi:hypothetical protein
LVGILRSRQSSSLPVSSRSLRHLDGLRRRAAGSHFGRPIQGHRPRTWRTLPDHRDMADDLPRDNRDAVRDGFDGHDECMVVRDDGHPSKPGRCLPGFEWKDFGQDDPLRHDGSDGDRSFHRQSTGPGQRRIRLEMVLDHRYHALGLFQEQHLPVQAAGDLPGCLDAQLQVLLGTGHPGAHRTARSGVRFHQREIRDQSERHLLLHRIGRFRQEPFGIATSHVESGRLRIHRSTRTGSPALGADGHRVVPSLRFSRRMDPRQHQEDRHRLPQPRVPDHPRGVPDGDGHLVWKSPEPHPQSGLAEFSGRSVRLWRHQR